MAKKPPVLKLHELKINSPAADCFALLIEKNRVTTRDGKIFFNCRFKDARRSVASAIWSDAPLFSDCEAAWEPGTVYKLRAIYSEHDRYGPKIEIVQIREATEEDEADGFKFDDFLERARTPSGEMFDSLRAIVESEIANEPLKALVLVLLDENKDALLPLPATAKQFYPFPGGWLEHVLAVTRNCLWLADQYRERYPDLAFNRDLVLAAAVLHDLGRVKELMPTIQGAEATVEGRLLGHITLGRDMIRDAARGIEELSGELLLLLDHLIHSHLTLPEWGSPRLPMIPEALILFHADDLDAKFEMYARHLLKDVSSGAFTEKDPVLGKQLLKRRDV